MSEEKPKLARKATIDEKIVKTPKNGKNIKTELRNAFERIMGKLNENSTIEIGFKELQNIIRDNKSPEDLRVYLNSLSSYLSNSTINAKERIVLIIGFIASVYRENLIDPLEKDLVGTIRKVADITKCYYEGKFFRYSSRLLEYYQRAS